LTTTFTYEPMDMVKRLEPVLRENAMAAEAERNLPKAAMTAMVEAGIFRTWMPRAFGGLEMAPTPAIQLFEELARIDSAAGWVASNSCAITPLCQVLPDAGAMEICADPDTVLAGGWFPPGSAVPVAGGYRVSGQWTFGSGCQHAHWLTAMGIISDDGKPRLGPKGQPVQVMLFFPFAEAEIVDTWHTLGMRGTGSHDIKLTEVFIPERRTFIMGPFDHPGSAFRGPLYAFRLWLFGPPIASVALGIARAAIEDCIALAGRKIPNNTQVALSDRSTVQDRVARAKAMVDAARAYLYRALDDTWAYLSTGAPITPEQGIPVQLATCHAVETAGKAVDLVHAVVGTSGIRNEHRFQQYFRDVHTVSQHASGASERFESVGKLLLGKPSDWGFFYV
jgi:alkylation response protein AidB-like acyl-CoA dehydrogenase